MWAKKMTVMQLVQIRVLLNISKDTRFSAVLQNGGVAPSARSPACSHDFQVFQGKAQSHFTPCTSVIHPTGWAVPVLGSHGVVG